MTAATVTRRRILLWLLAAAATTAALAAVQGAGRELAARLLSPAGAARWIWAPGLDTGDGPVCFYLVREFELDFAPYEANLLALADEEYLVYLNGQLVGANRYSQGAPLDGYVVRRFLRRGYNRLLVEARSSRGLGGLLLALRVRAAGEGGETLEVVSDGSWGVIREHRRDLLGGRTPLGVADEALVWGAPPAGRWGLPRRVEPRPSVPTLRGRRPPVDAVLAKLGREADEWTPIGPPHRFAPALGSWVVFDWGREVTGYLGLRFRDGEQPAGLVFAGPGPAYPQAQRADTFLIPMPGRNIWTDSAPRRFRYATFVGLASVNGAQVFPTDPGRSAALFPGPDQMLGVFGLASLRLRTPFENQLWRQLEAIPEAPQEAG